MNNPHSSTQTDPRELWDSVIEALRPELGDDALDLWLKPVQPALIQDGLFTVRVPNKFFSDWIKNHYQRKIEDLLKDLTGEDLGLLCEVASGPSPSLEAPRRKIEPVEEAPKQSDFKLATLNPKYTFETFVVGPSNRWAHATAQAIAKNPGRQYNPFFLYGGVGLGKTHLMHAIGHAIHRANPKAQVLYTTSEQFVNEYIDSLRYDKPDAFRNKFRGLDVLLIDDIQFIIGKGRSEEEFFYTFNSLFDSRKQIVITSDRAPKEMSPGEQRLISRFEWGVVADIRTPDLETRIAILRKKAEAEGLQVPDDVILFIASKIKTNIRELEGCLIRVSAYSSLTGSALSVDVAKEVLKDTVSGDDMDAQVRVETVQRVVADKYSVEVRDLTGKGRSKTIALPRQVAMYLCCAMTEQSSGAIGEAFGGRDHSTVLHAKKKIEEQLSDPFFNEMINGLIQKIKSVENA